MIPIGTSYRMTRRPWVNYALIAANIVVFLLGFNGMGDEYGQIKPAVEPYLLHPHTPELHQFFSSVFLHGSWWHLIGNMIFLWVFGNAINDRFGHAGYLAFYLAGGILACIGYVFLAGYAPMLGASGAIAAVTGAYLVLLPRVRVTVLVIFFYVLMPLEVSSLLFLLFQFGINMWMSLSPAITGQSAGGVAYAAHSSGYLFGIALSVILLSVRLLPRDAYDLLNLIRNWHRRQQYRRMVAQGYDPFAATMAYQKSGREGKRRVSARTVEASTPGTAAARELELRREISEACQRHDLETAARLYLALVQIAEDAVLPQAYQLDVANQLMAAEQYAAAADAYERLLSHYRDYQYVGDIYLMLGVIYGRYLQQYDRAEQMLQRALERLRDPGKITLAKADLQAVRQRRGT